MRSQALLLAMTGCVTESTGGLPAPANSEKRVQARHDESVAVLCKPVRNPDYHARAQAYENLGLAELRAANPVKARDAFLRAVDLNFAQVRSNLELADMAYADGDYQAAHDFYNSYRTRARQTPRSLYPGIKLGQVFGDLDQTASYAMALQNLYPESPEARECEVPK
jgi:type IV pilus assembly protein PilF